MPNGGYSGDSLVDMIDNAIASTEKAGENLAKAFVERGQTNIERNTPVETRHLRESWDHTDITYGQAKLLGYTSIRWSYYAWTGTVFTEVEYAPFVEAGTGLWGPKRKKYKIAPKKPGGVLAFGPYQRMPNGGVILDVQGNVTKGDTIFVRYVMHPGSPGAHMIRIGAELTESEFRQWSEEPLRLWVHDVESKSGAQFRAKVGA